MEGSKAYIKIPRARVGALVGPGGSVKSVIERKLSVSLDVESETGAVQITMPSTAEDPTVLFRAKEVVTAIGRGVENPKAGNDTRAGRAMNRRVEISVQ